MSFPPNSHEPHTQPSYAPTQYAPAQQHPAQQPVQQFSQSPQTPASQPSPTTLAYTNTFALLSFIMAFIMPLIGIIFGHIALGQIKRGGDAGRGLALAGTVIGYVLIGIVLLYIIWIFVMFAGFIAMIGELSQFGSEFDTPPYSGDEFDF